MALITAMMYDQFGRFIGAFQGDELLVPDNVANNPDAVGWVSGFYEPNDYYWNGTAVVATAAMTPTVSAYQAASGVVVNITNLPRMTRLIVRNPTEVGLPVGYYIPANDDGSLAFSSNVEGVYEIELDAPKFADSLIELQVGSAVIDMQVLRMAEQSLEHYANLVQQDVSTKAMTQTNLAVNINANTNIQPEVKAFVMTLPTHNDNARTNIAMTTKAFVQTLLELAIDNVDGIEIDTLVMAQTNVAVVINANTNIQLEDSLYYPVRSPAANLRQNVSITMTTKAITQSFPVVTIT